MSDDIIIGVIKDMHKYYIPYKDGGREYVFQLSKKLQNTVESDKKDVFNFFLREIRDNQHGLADVALLTIVEMKERSMSEQLFLIYVDLYLSKDIEWRYSMITSMMILGYDLHKDIYYDFVSLYMDKDKNGFRVYPLLVYYSSVDDSRGIPLLVKYFSDLIDRNVDLSNYIVFLISTLGDCRQVLVDRLLKELTNVNVLYGVAFEKALSIL